MTLAAAPLPPPRFPDVEEEEEAAAEDAVFVDEDEAGFLTRCF